MNGECSSCGEIFRDMECPYCGADNSPWQGFSDNYDEMSDAERLHEGLAMMETFND